jgi:hypothetical protein
LTVQPHQLVLGIVHAGTSQPNLLRSRCSGNPTLPDSDDFTTQQTDLHDRGERWRASCCCTCRGLIHRRKVSSELRPAAGFGASRQYHLRLCPQVAADSPPLDMAEQPGISLGILIKGRSQRIAHTS